jgi:AcrR family transcriptional regulator
MRAPDTELRWVRPPQQARSRRTLDRILDAAEALVSEKGFEDATVAELVGRANASVGAFYSRFRDKDGLLHALYERHHQQAVATADDALDPARWEGAPTARILRAVIRFLARIYREQRGLMRAFALRVRQDPEFHLRSERLSRHVAERLAALLRPRLRELAHHDPERAIAFGLTVVASTLESAILFDELRALLQVPSDDDLAAELSTLYLAYLGIREDPS